MAAKASAVRELWAADRVKDQVERTLIGGQFVQGHHRLVRAEQAGLVLPCGAADLGCDPGPGGHRELHGELSQFIPARR